MASFLGKKISLISKAGIRYEGILYTIDPTESTVALSKVKSFGTEDRVSERFISPRDEVYEYIIFRGSDIRDLHVCENSMYSEDSAIVKIMSPTFTNQSPLHVTMPQYGIDVNTAPDIHPSNQDRSPLGFYSKTNLKDNIQSKNSSLTPSKSMDSSIVVDSKPLQIPRSQENNTFENHETSHRQKKSEHIDMDKIATNDYHNFMNREQIYKYDSFSNDDDREPPSYRRGDYHHHEGGAESGGNQYRRGMRHQNSRRAGGNGIPASRSHWINKEIIIEPIKDDFDFESSNALLAEELANLAVAANEDSQNKTFSENKDLSDITCSDYGDDKLYYDKSRSFFDNISSEMSERPSSDRRNERRSNTETFGDSNYSRGNRGNRWGNRRGQIRGNPGRVSSAGFLRRGNFFNRGEMRFRGSVVGSSNTNKRMMSVGGGNNRGPTHEN